MLDYNEFYLTLVRHGESIVNATPDIIGQLSDVPLSEKGRLQAKLLGERLVNEHQWTIDRVYSSTYTRAIDTANISLMNVPHTTLKTSIDLREYSAGDWIGKNRNDVLNSSVKSKMGLLGHSFLPPNGESLNQVGRRVSEWVEENILYDKETILDAQTLRDRKEKPLNIFVFSHGLTIKCLLHHIMGFDQSFTWKVTIDNTSMSKLYFGKEGWRLLSINDHAHLSTLYNQQQL